MDKLSNKLKLSRSQSMGVGMGGGGDKMPTNMRRNESGGSSGRQASIVLLDERRLEMHIQPRLYAGELLDLVDWSEQKSIFHKTPVIHCVFALYVWSDQISYKNHRYTCHR